MSKLLKYSGDVRKALKTVREIMKSEGFDFVTWSTAQTGARFITKKETVEKMYLNKFEKGAEVDASEVVKISNSGLTLNEMQEAGKGSTLKNGFGGKEVTKISKQEINLADNVLYNENFDCSSLFEAK